MVPPLDPAFRAFLAIDDRPMGPLALALRDVVLEEAPQVIEQLYRNHPSALWYGHGLKFGEMVVYIAMASAHVNLGFCRGALLPDPGGVLEGTGKTMRHIKLRSEADFERPSVRPLIRAAFAPSR